jgi:hypothetical protein
MLTGAVVRRPALAPGSERSGLAGRLGPAVQAAQRHHPVSTAEVQLMHATPANARALRRTRRRLKGEQVNHPYGSGYIVNSRMPPARNGGLRSPVRSH